MRRRKRYGKTYFFGELTEEQYYKLKWLALINIKDISKAWRILSLIASDENYDEKDLSAACEILSPLLLVNRI